MKTLIKLGLMQATWAWAGIILFMVLGFTKLAEASQRESNPKTRIEKLK